MEERAPSSGAALSAPVCSASSGAFGKPWPAVACDRGPAPACLVGRPL